MQTFPTAAVFSSYHQIIDLVAQILDLQPIQGFYHPTFAIIYHVTLQNFGDALRRILYETVMIII